LEIIHVFYKNLKITYFQPSVVALNVVPVSSTKRTPYEVVFGRKPNLHGYQLPESYEESIGDVINFRVSQPQGNLENRKDCNGNSMNDIEEG
jgi:hypothetical protein